MRSLDKNKKKMYYALYDKEEEVFNEDGDFVENKIVYKDPVEFEASISSGKGSAQKEIFGKDVDFTRSISTTDISLPISVTSLIWVDTEPVISKDGKVDPSSADYEVAAKPALGLYVMDIALRERTK